MQPDISVKHLSKVYGDGFQALKNINLDIRRGEIFALLGPNGAGKTTLISIICGIVNLSSGEVKAAGYDIVKDYRKARETIGLVPQELNTDSFETVWDAVSFSRGLFGKPPKPSHIEKVLKDLSLWDKRNNRIMSLSGGMKRRVMIAKALSHEPQILFLDEPTAGVDVELRRDMWDMVRKLRESGVTIILTTHYIEEAEEMADRIGVIRQGEIILVEDKTQLMTKLGKKELRLHLAHKLDKVPGELTLEPVELSEDGYQLIYTFDSQQEQAGVARAAVDVEADDVGHLEQLGHGAHAPGVAVGGAVGDVVEHHAHAEGLGHRGELGADVAVADDAQLLAADFVAVLGGLQPFAAMGLGVFLWNTTQEQDGLGQNQFGNAPGVGERRVEYGNPAPGGCLEIHLVGADTETAHGHQLVGGFKYFLCQLGARADTDEVRIGDFLDQLFLGQRVRQVLDVGIARSVQGINGRLMDAFQQQDTDFALLKRRI